MKIEIKELKDKILVKIENAAKSADTKSIPMLSQMLTEVEEIDKTFSNLLLALNALKTRLNECTSNTVLSNGEEKTYQTEVTAKRRGALLKAEFIESVKYHGCYGNSVNSATFNTRSGLTVGMAYASEINPNRWFLGLRDGKYDTAVLICERFNRSVERFILPKKFFRKHFSKLSRDKTYNQIKLNVALLNDKFIWKIPGSEEIDISGFRDNFRVLITE